MVPALSLQGQAGRKLDGKSGGHVSSLACGQPRGKKASFNRLQPTMESERRLVLHEASPDGLWIDGAPGVSDQPAGTVTENVPLYESGGKSVPRQPVKRLRPLQSRTRCTKSRASSGRLARLTTGVLLESYRFSKCTLCQRRPKVIAKLYGQKVKLAKLCGGFPWHHHEHKDEMFLVWRGRMKIEFREHMIELGAGEFCILPRGIEHRTMADNKV